MKIWFLILINKNGQLSLILVSHLSLIMFIRDFYKKLPASSNRILLRSRHRRLCNGIPTTNHRSHRSPDTRRSKLLGLSCPTMAQAILRKKQKATQMSRPAVHTLQPHFIILYCTTGDNFNIKHLDIFNYIFF